MIIVEGIVIFDKWKFHVGILKEKNEMKFARPDLGMIIQDSTKIWSTASPGMVWSIALK